MASHFGMQGNLDALTESEQAALARELADRNGPVAVAIALLEHAADLFQDKDKPRTANGYVRTAAELREMIDLPRPSAIGIDRLLDGPSAANAEESGREVLVAVERLARRVIQRELTPGGFIQRYVQQQLEARA